MPVEPCKLTIVASDGMDDWYVIERAEHDGRVWFEQLPGGGAAFMTSARFSDADVEGTAAEMRAIADGIRRRTTGVEFKRCAVAVGDGVATFWSPRNSQREGAVPYADALALADEIDAKLGSPTAEAP